MSALGHVDLARTNVRAWPWLTLGPGSLGSTESEAWKLPNVNDLDEIVRLQIEGWPGLAMPNMRSLAAVTLVAAFGLGCGSGSDPNSIVGSWIIYDSGGATFAGFNEDGAYNWGAFLIDSSGAVDTQEDIGTYDATGGVLNLTANKTTCADRPRLSYVDYQVFGGEMIWSGNTTRLVWTRNTTDISMGGTTATITYGCFETGTFVPAGFTAL